jgi:hypothetical protein
VTDFLSETSGDEAPKRNTKLAKIYPGLHYTVLAEADLSCTIQKDGGVQAKRVSVGASVTEQKSNSYIYSLPVSVGLQRN